MTRRRRRYELRDRALNEQLEALVASTLERYGERPDADQLRQVLVTALRLAKEASSGNLKLVSNALKELRHAFRVFAPYNAVPKVAVFGSARTQPGHPDWQQAHAFAERMVDAGWMVITGAGDGIMGAAQGGAGRAASFGVNIRLPFEQSANAVIDGDRKLVNFRYFFTRKVTFVKESHALALFPGGFGTHDEGFEALTLIQTGKSSVVPVVYVDEPGGSYWRDWHEYVKTHLYSRGLIGEEDLSLYSVTDDLDEAVEEILQFYRNYHSSRWLGDRLLIRLAEAPSQAQCEALADQFDDLLEAEPEVCGPLPEEKDDAPGLPRLAIRISRRRVGRLRQLIDRLNDLPAERKQWQETLPPEILARELSAEAEQAEEEDET
ncbi:MAG: LOG family protein [bacterium]|nr:LOG family protein [bacterium]